MSIIVYTSVFLTFTLGVRSVEFNEDMLSFGTGEGSVYFYDLRAGQYLSRQSSLLTKDEAKCSLRISKGYLVSNRLILLVLYSSALPCLALPCLALPCRAIPVQCIADSCSFFLIYVFTKLQGKLAVCIVHLL